MLARQDVVGGAVIVAFAAFAFWAGSDLPITPDGAEGGIGPGALPQGLALLLGILGLVLIANALLGRGARLDRWSIRAPVLILGAVVVFGLAVRPLGLAVAGPLAIVVGALASDEVRWRETLLFGALMTVFCIGLFKFALGLPIPLAPWLLGY